MAANNEPGADMRTPQQDEEERNQRELERTLEAMKIRHESFQPSVKKLITHVGDMAEFREKFSKVTLLSNATAPVIVGVPHQCNFLVKTGEDPEAMTLRAIIHCMMTTRDMHQFCAYAGSLITLVSPALGDFVRKALTEMGIELTTFNLPKELPALDLGAVPATADWTLALITWGCVILCLFKNATDLNHDKFMMARLRALYVHAHAVNYDAKTIRSLWSMTKSSSIKTGPGSERWRLHWGIC